MADADVIIAWAHGGIPESVKPAFQRPTRFVNLPNPETWAQSLAPYGYPSPVRGMLSKYAPGVTPLRVAMLGFSASCQGVAQVLSSADATNLDAVIAVDGIHVGYADKAKRALNEAGMKPWLDYGALAAVNERLFIDSYSSVVPPGYASTTETANWLWEKLTSNTQAYAADIPVPDIVVPPTSVTTSVNGPTRTVQYPTAPWKAKRRRDGLIMYGCNNLDPSGTTDHIYQGSRVLPVLLTEILARRWNEIDPKAPGQTCFLGGPSARREVIWLSQQQLCAKSKVLPPNYMTAVTPTSRSRGSNSIVPIVLGGLAIAGIAAFATAPKTALAQNPLPSWYTRPAWVFQYATQTHVPADEYRGWYVLRRCSYSHTILGEYATLDEVERAIKKLPKFRGARFRDCWYAVVSRDEYEFHRS